MTDAEMSQAADFVMLFILLTLLMLGGLSMLLGKAVSWYDDITSSQDVDDDQKTLENTTVATALPSVLHPITKPQNDRNSSLHFAEAAKVEALAQLILESRRIAFKNGVVPETRAIKALFGESPSSDPNSDYKRLKLMLAAKLTDLQPPAKSQYRTLDDKCQPLQTTE